MSREPQWPWEKRRWPAVAVFAVVLAAALPCLGAVGLLAFLGAGIETGLVPDTKAVPGEKLSERNLRFLRESELIAEGERVIYFYSGGVLDIEGDGSFFTDRRVVRYWEDDETGELASAAAEYPEITGIEPAFEEEWMADSRIVVTVEDGEDIVLHVCNDERGDREFAKKLREEWERRR